MALDAGLLIEAFRANVDSAFHVAYRLVWNRADAENVVQNAFVKAIRGIDRLEHPERIRSWLLSITYREALMVLRSRRDTPTDPFELPDRPGHRLDPAELAVEAELARLLSDAIDGLPDTLRLAFVLRDVEELPMRDVADVLGIGVSAAKMRVTRAREVLRADLGGRLAP